LILSEVEAVHEIWFDGGRYADAEACLRKLAAGTKRP